MDEEKVEEKVEAVEVEEPQAEPITEEPVEAEEVEETVKAEEKPKFAELDIHLNIGKAPSYLKECFELLQRLGYDEVTLRIKGGNLKIFEMDASRVCLVSATFPLGLEVGDEVAFAVKVKPILTVLTVFDNPHFAIDGNKLVVEDKDIVYADGRKVSVTPKRYEVSLLMPNEDDVESIEKSLEKLSLNAFGRVDFSKLWKYAKVFGSKSGVDNIKFECNNVELSATFKGDFEFLRVRLGGGEGEAKASYSIHYLKAFKGEWNIRFATDMPIKLSDSLSGITVYIAPRISSD